MTPPQKPKLSRGVLSPAGSDGGSSVSSRLPRPGSSVSMSRISSLPRPPSTGALSSRGASGDLADSSTSGCNQKDYISVAVRVRPIKYEVFLSCTHDKHAHIPHQSQLHQRCVLTIIVTKIVMGLHLINLHITSLTKLMPYAHAVMHCGFHSGRCMQLSIIPLCIT